MKKFIALILSVTLIVATFVSCGDKKVNEETPKAQTTIRIGGLKGPTSIGMVKMLDDAENSKTANKYDFTLAGAADELTPKFINNQLDIVALPINLASVLYNKTNNAQLLAINTLGIIYIVEKGGNTVNSISDLKGKTIYATGKNSTPEYALNYLLEKSGIKLNEVNVIWKSEPTEVVANMKQDSNAIAMMPQPYVTVASKQLENLRIAVNMTKEWEKLDKDSAFLTAGVIVRKDFVKKNKEAVLKFLKEYSDSVKYVNKNVDSASTLVEKYDIINANIAKEAIPKCNIVCIDGAEMQKMTAGYLKVLYNQNPSSIGGKIPEKDFYFINEK